MDAFFYYQNPKIDLKVSNNVVHLRTCADSCTALARLILYLANDGDHSPPQLAAAQQQWGDHQKQPREEIDVDEEVGWVWIRSGRVRLGQIWSGQVKLGPVGSGRVKPLHSSSGEITRSSLENRYM